MDEQEAKLLDAKLIKACLETDDNLRLPLWLVLIILASLMMNAFWLGVFSNA